ncbi:hypothetical protein DL95DRAFT_83665 [Leptodontidium sp. 2 PMI_412]|nr:hypothetical protein DL95DRAFT_83665 [Leptodontidium sp. 2 PMI_412]
MNQTKTHPSTNSSPCPPSIHSSKPSMPSKAKAKSKPAIYFCFPYQYQSIEYLPSPFLSLHSPARAKMPKQKKNLKNLYTTHPSIHPFLFLPFQQKARKARKAPRSAQCQCHLPIYFHNLILITSHPFHPSIHSIPFKGTMIYHPIPSHPIPIPPSLPQPTNHKAKKNKNKNKTAPCKKMTENEKENGTTTMKIITHLIPFHPISTHQSTPHSKE